MNYLGIDPSQRHVGLALAKEGASLPLLQEIRPEEKDLLSSIVTLRKKFYAFLKENTNLTDVAFSIEKQGSGGESSLRLFYVQMAIFEVIHKINPNPVIINPLPVQMRSYMKRVHKVDVSSKSAIVRSWNDTHGRAFPRKRYSSHCVEAFYFMLALKDLLEGKWAYRPTSREDSETIFPFKIVYGDPNARPT